MKQNGMTVKEIWEVFRINPGASKRLAKQMQVSPGMVSQVLNSWRFGKIPSAPVLEAARRMAEELRKA